MKLKNSQIETIFVKLNLKLLKLKTSRNHWTVMS